MKYPTLQELLLKKQMSLDDLSKLSGVKKGIIIKFIKGDWNCVYPRHISSIASALEQKFDLTFRRRKNDAI